MDLEQRTQAAKRRARSNVAGKVGPIVRIGPDVHRVVDEAVRALAFDADIYQRDGQLVRVVRVAENEADAIALEGTPQIRHVHPATLRERLTACAQFVKHDGRSDSLRPCVPTDAVVAGVAARGQWPRVRPIVGVIEAPSLRPDGSVIQADGYDSTTGFVLVSGTDFGKVADAPTIDDARSALEVLKEPLVDFPYATEAHRSATIAAILSIVGRPAIVGSVPGFVFDASTRGSGKTLQADVVSIIATGRVSAKMGYPTDDEELEKILGAYALRGAALVNFDNVSRPFGGGPLDRCITATDSVELRILGRSEVPSLRWRAVIMATGNNVELVGDTSRRVLFSRLEPREEDPEHRSGFAHTNLRAWVGEHRSRIVIAALTLLRAYVVAGCPDVGVRPWGSFESWSQLVPSAIVWAGGASPLEARPAGDAATEPEKAALATLMALWPRLGEDGITAKGAVQRLYPGGRLPHPSEAPDGLDDLRDAIETLTKTPAGKAPSSHRLGYALRRVRRRNLGGWYFEPVRNRENVLVWKILSAESLRKFPAKNTVFAPDTSVDSSSDIPHVTSIATKNQYVTSSEGAGDAGNDGQVTTLGTLISNPMIGGENKPSSPLSPAVGEDEWLSSWLLEEGIGGPGDGDDGGRS